MQQNTRGWNISNVHANKMTNWQNFISFSLIWRRGIYSSFLIVTIQLLRGEKMQIKEALTDKYLLRVFMQASLNNRKIYTYI